MSTVANIASSYSGSDLMPLQMPSLNKGEKAAREFESQLIGSVLASMEKTFASVPGEDEMTGADNYNYLGTQALAKVVTNGGGFGIAHMISAYLQRAETRR